MPIHPDIGHHHTAQAQEDRQAHWDERYGTGFQPRDGEPNPWVLAQAPYLRGGRALDVACGTGRHALWLASLGYDVDAVDWSAVGLARATEIAVQRGLADHIRFIHADLRQWRPPATHYDLVLVVRYLDRNLWPALAAATKPGGLALYTTFNIDILHHRPEIDPVYLLRPGEFLEALPGWTILAYEERRWSPGSESHADCTSSILARKPLASPSRPSPVGPAL